MCKNITKSIGWFTFNSDGLSKWFSDDVNVKDDVYTFYWDGSEEQARLINKKNGEFIKWQWLDDEEDELDSYFEMKYTVDPMTKTTILSITDFAEASKKMKLHGYGNLKLLIYDE